MGAVFHLFPISAVLLYIAATAGYGALLWSGGEALQRLPRRLLQGGLVLHVLAVLVHAIDAGLLSGRLLGESSLVATLPFTLSLISALVVGLFLLLERRSKVSALGPFVAPLAIFFLLFSGVLFHVDRPGAVLARGGPLLWFHISATVLGHVAFVVAFGVSLALIVQESLLKKKRFSQLQRTLPSLKVLDRLNLRLLWGGFFCMMCGVMAGFIFGFLNEIAFFGFNSRVFWSFLTLLVYGLLLGAQTMCGWRGRRAAWVSVAGFCTVLASFVSASFVGGSFHVH